MSSSVGVSSDFFNSARCVVFVPGAMENRSCPPDRAQADEQNRGERIIRRFRDPEISKKEKTEQTKEDKKTDETELFADDRENEIRGRLRQKTKARLRAFADPLAEPSARADRDLRLGDVVCRAIRIRFRKQKRGDAIALVRPQADGPKKRHGRHGREEQDPPRVARQTAEEDHREPHGDENHRGPEIRLKENESDIGENRERASPKDGPREPLPNVTREKRREIDREGNLREFDGLE